LQFWDLSQTSMDKLYLPALRPLSVPASSATAESVQLGWDHYTATQGMLDG